MPRNWADLVGQMTDVQKLVHLAMRQDVIDEDAIRSELVKARRREYETTLTELAQKAGCNRTALVSEGETLSEFNELSKQDATSIVNTYNYDLGVAIIAISTETPTANRNTYAKRLRTWDNNRATWKNNQIAVNTNLTARSMAQRDFAQFNTVTEGEAFLAGPDPAAEPICQGWINRGKVPTRIAIENPSPFHINCPHVWEMIPVKLGKGECDELWMG